MNAFTETRPTANARIIWWKNRRGTDESYVLALADFSYIVVVADRGDFVLPWTAYCVEHEHRRNKLRKEYDAYWNTPKC